MLQLNKNKKELLFSVVCIICFSCISNNPNQYLNPNKSAIIAYELLLKKTEKYSKCKGFGNRKILLEGIQSAYKLELLTKSGNFYQTGDFVITKKISIKDVEFWKEWLRLNRNYIEWDYIKSNIYVNELYEDSINIPPLMQSSCSYLKEINKKE